MFEVETISIISPFIISFCVTSVTIWGWFKISRLNRENEIFKKKLEEKFKRRMIMFESVVESLIPFANPVDGRPNIPGEELSRILLKARINVQLYGMVDEIKEFEKLIDAINNNEMAVLNDRLVAVLKMMKGNLKAELGIPE